MCDIKILVATHKETFVPENTFLYPIQVGCALTQERLPTALHDDEGINIADKNKSYCELTAQYWAWKNLKADYYGFFHYRRYMSFAHVYPVGEDGRPIGARRQPPYMEADSLDGNLSDYMLDEEHIQAAAADYDVLTVLSEHMDVTVYEQFCQFHEKEDLDRAIAIMKKQHKEQSEACDIYMNSKYIYFCNMYIMKRDYFDSYMEWLFPVLEEFEKEKDFSGCGEKEQRITGYIAERLFGVYYTWLKQETQAKCAEVQYVIFHQKIRKVKIGEKGPVLYIDMKKLNRIMPAGSLRRRVVRRLFRRKL